jgi:aspartate/methionine/tyrosine aminotransferase
MFMLIDVSATGLSGAEFVQALYATQGVSVMDGAAFGVSTARCVRVCFATDESTLDRACARLREFCEHHLPNKMRAASAARTDTGPIR